MRIVWLFCRQILPGFVFGTMTIILYLKIFSPDASTQISISLPERTFFSFIFVVSLAGFARRIEGEKDLFNDISIYGFVIPLSFASVYVFLSRNDYVCIQRRKICVMSSTFHIQPSPHLVMEICNLWECAGSLPLLKR